MSSETKCAVLITDWAGDPHYFGPFVNQSAAEKWLRKHVSKKLENSIVIADMGQAVWDIIALQNPSGGL